MSEYFIGIVPPQPLYNSIINVQKKYISRLGIEPHVTLKAQSGLTEDEKWIEEVKNIISNFKQFKVDIKGSSYFGSIVLFIAVGSSELDNLHNSLINTLNISHEQQKKYFEGPDFIGHITVGKTTYPSNLSSNTLTTEQLDEMEKEITKNIKLDSFLVDEVWIYKKVNNSYERYKNIKLSK